MEKDYSSKCDYSPKPEYPEGCKDCKGSVKESATLGECKNYPYPYPGYAKIPVVIAEFTVQIDVESKIALDEPALEIKRIKKNVFLTQCRLIPGTKKVFLKGYVRKNIEYATKKGYTKTAICGDIKHTTVFVPFECITKIEDFKNYPKIFPNHPTQDVEYLDCKECDNKNMGVDLKERDFISKEVFNEKVFCELEKAYIYEADIAEDWEKIHCFPSESVFKTFIEKEVIYLTLKLLQKQQVHYFPQKPHKYEKEYEDEYEKDYEEKKYEKKPEKKPQYEEDCTIECKFD
jgi:hypothetical protein